VAVVGVAVGISFLPSFKKPAMIGLIGWLVITVLTPTLWSNLSFNLQGAFGTRRLATETRLAETVGKRGAQATRWQQITCDQWEDNYNDKEIGPLVQFINTLLPSDPRVPTRMAMLKQKREYAALVLKENCGELAYGPSESWRRKTWWEKINMPSRRAAITILIIIMLFSGTSLYGAKKDSPWTRWVGGTILIVLAAVLGYVIFDAGFDQKIEEGVTRVWEASTKPTPPPPAPKPKEPEKEEKKIRAGKTGRIVLKNEELKTPRAYQVRANYGPFANPDGVASFSEGEDFELLAFGTGGCSVLIPLRGTFAIYYPDGTLSPNLQRPGIGLVSNCNNQPIRGRALTDLVIFGGACPRPPGKPDNYGCLVFD
jgi:hypothetical protein